MIMDAYGRRHDSESPILQASTFINASIHTWDWPICVLIYLTGGFYETFFSLQESDTLGDVSERGDT